VPNTRRKRIVFRFKFASDMALIRAMCLLLRIGIDAAHRGLLMEDVNDGHDSTVEPLAKARRAESIDVVPRGNAALLQMAEYTGDLIGLCDAGGRLVYLNPAGRRLIGIEDADIFPMRLTDYVVPHQRHLVDEVVVPTARRDGVWRGDMQLANLRTGAIIDVQRSTFATRATRRCPRWSTTCSAPRG